MRNSVLFAFVLVSAGLSSHQQDASSSSEPGALDAPVVLWHEAKTLLPTRVFHPPNFDPEESQTLLLGFHGYGGSADGFAEIARTLADMGFLVALPECGYPLLANGTLGYDWFLTQTGDEDLGRRTAELLMSDHVPALLSDMKEHYSIDQIYTLGFSQGAVAALGTAVLHPSRFDGAALFGLPNFSTDWFPGESLLEGKDVRLLFLHGEDDAVAPLSVSETTQTLLREAGYACKLQTFPGGHTVPLDQLGHVADWILE